MAEHDVLLGGFSHETNTFAPTRTTRADFQARREHFGGAVIDRLTGTNTAIGGAIAAAEEADVALHPTVAASATPGGLVAADAYATYTDAIVEGAESHAGSLDGVLLALHGAMVPEGHDDGEAPLARRVREAVGPDVPIAVTHDLHGNVTDELIDTADLLVAYETYPHVDMGETGRRGVELLVRTIEGALDPVMAVERPPVLPFTPTQNTREGPMAEVMAHARELEDREDVVKVNVFPGFHAADVPAMGFSVPVIGDANEQAAREAARELAAAVWDRREAFLGDYPDPAAGVTRAKATAAEADPGDGPVVIADVGDNPGGGGTGDETAVLAELLEQAVTDAGFAILHDPDAVEACIEAGVGERVTVDLGGTADGGLTDPVEGVEGYVRTITDGEFVNTGPMGTGTENHLGRTVRFECGSEDGLAVLLVEGRLQPLDAEIWRHAGIQPERLGVLCVKSANHFRADYEPMASEVIAINSPGLATMDPRRFEYDRIRRPQFPLDGMAADAYPDWA